MPNSGSVTPKARGVQELLHGLPVALRREARDHADEHGMPIPKSRNREMITVRYRAIGSSRTGDGDEDRAEPVGDPQREGDSPADQHRTEQELQDPVKMIVVKTLR